MSRTANNSAADPGCGAGVSAVSDPAATVERMRDLVQCVIRDSAANPQSRNYFVLEGARACTVSDQMMKKS